MESHGFYVTLPSNASLDVHPGNTLSNYTVQLPRTLYLKPGFEVALAEIQYPLSWKTVPEYTFGVLDFTEDVDVTTIVFPDAHYDSVLELVRVINKNLITFFEIKDLPKRTIMLTYDELTNKVTLNATTGYGLALNEELTAIFGFDKSQNLHKEIPKTDIPLAIDPDLQSICRKMLRILCYALQFFHFLIGLIPFDGTLFIKVFISDLHGYSQFLVFAFLACCPF